MSASTVLLPPQILRLCEASIWFGSLTFGFQVVLISILTLSCTCPESKSYVEGLGGELSTAFASLAQLTGLAHASATMPCQECCWILGDIHALEAFCGNPILPIREAHEVRVWTAARQAGARRFRGFESSLTGVPEQRSGLLEVCCIDLVLKQAGRLRRTARSGSRCRAAAPQGDSSSLCQSTLGSPAVH